MRKIKVVSFYIIYILYYPIIIKIDLTLISQRYMLNTKTYKTSKSEDKKKKGLKKSIHKRKFHRQITNDQ